MTNKASKTTNKESDKLKNKLISIRMPEKMLEDLKDVAESKGDMGYQKLIKAMINEGLSEAHKKQIVDEGLRRKAERGAASKASADVSVAPEPKSDPSVLKKRRNMSALRNSEVIAEDIENLANALEPYHQFFAGHTFLITGAYGFLGRYMVALFQYLNEEVFDEEDAVKALLMDNFVTGYEQRVVHDKNLDFIRHNVIEPFSTDQPVDYILHMAGIASPAYYTKFPIETMDVGTTGTRHMLDLAYKKGVKGFLFTSSSEVYGDPDPTHVPTNEEYYGNVSILGPRSCYDESKRFGETMCLAYYDVYDVPVKMVRPFNVYGPGIRPDDYRVLPNFIEHALRKEPLPIHGDGRNTRSFCYINDAIEAIFRVLFSEVAGEAFNIGNPGPEISVKDLAYKVQEAMPHPVDVVLIDPPHAVYASSDPKRRCPDIGKLQTVTGFEPKVSLEEGLRRTIKWFQES